VGGKKGRKRVCSTQGRKKRKGSSRRFSREGGGGKGERKKWEIKGRGGEISAREKGGESEEVHNFFFLCRTREGEKNRGGAERERIRCLLSVLEKGERMIVDSLRLFRKRKQFEGEKERGGRDGFY